MRDNCRQSLRSRSDKRLLRQSTCPSSFVLLMITFLLLITRNCSTPGKAGERGHQKRRKALLL
jgi:hypothetical protein